MMEALALGRPSITTYVAGIPELVRNGENGWLVPAGDVSALADAIDSLLDAPVEVLTAMGRAGHARVARQHDPLRNAERLSELCEEAEAAGRRGRSDDLETLFSALQSEFGRAEAELARIRGGGVREGTDP